MRQPDKGLVFAVDDEEAPLKSVESALANRHQVVPFESPLDVLRALKKTRPDLLITDISMPEMDGLQLVEAAVQEHINLPIMILTGFGDLSSAQLAMRLGARDYLTKPFQPAKFQSRVDELIQRGRDSNRLTRNLQNLNTQLSQELASRVIQEDALQSSAEFLHDLRSPLTMILYYLDVLQEKISPQHRRVTHTGSDLNSDEALAQIKQSVLQCSQLADMWQDLNTPIERLVAPVQFRKAMETCLDTFQPVARAQQVSLSVSALPDAMVNISVPHFQRVLHNILTNALHAVRGVDEPRIQLQAFLSRDELKIHVRDNGCGIPKDQLDQIFQPYVSSRLEAGGGTGLGLPISQKIIEALDGSLQIISDENIGTSALVCLPLTMTEDTCDLR